MDEGNISANNLTGNDQTNQPGKPLKIGELLIKERYIKQADLEKALDIQKQRRHYQDLPLGKILVELGALSEATLDELLQHPELKRKIGSLAVEKGLVTEEQLETCLSNKEESQLVGQALVGGGYITHEDLNLILREQLDAHKLGELAVKLNYISEKDLQSALRMQKSPPKLGEILVELDFLNPMDLQHVLKKYNKSEGIEKTLLNMGYINENQLNIARQENQYGNESLGELLIRKKFITAEQYRFAQTKQYNIPFKYLEGFEYSDQNKQDLSKLISQRYAESKMIIPISLIDNKLTIGLFDPERMMNTIYDLRSMYQQFQLACVLITQQKYTELFESLYNITHKTELSPEEDEVEVEDDVDFMELDFKEEIAEQEKDGGAYGSKDIEAEEIVNFIVKYGIINNASDIHVEQDRAGVKLRYRIDGVLRESNIKWLRIKLREKIGAIVSRIKVMSKLDIAERRMPQDGVFRMNYYDKEEGKKFDLDFRVATCRASVGENVTIRILDSRKANIGLENLNHSPYVLDPFKTLLKSSAGMILVAGPTGSGKSSTLYAALHYVYNPGIKIITAEDPIEYNFPGIMQTQVNYKINLTFARLLRSFLRLDPDVILIGEVRDNETASIGFDAAQTGHLLLSTIHTNDAVGAIPRLLDLDIEYGQISSSLMCVLAQRLVRRTCPSCSEEYIPEESEWGHLFKKYPGHLRFYRAKGCEACSFIGFKGRTLLSEIFVINGEIVEALNKGHKEDDIKRIAIECGMKTMIEDGLLKLNQTTLSEILRVLPYEMIKSFRSRDAFQEDADFLIDQLLSGEAPLPEQEISSTYEIFNPETERATIDLMKSKFDHLSSNGGNQPALLDSKLFREFIIDSFSDISNQYQCKSITFQVTKNQDSGIAEISAVPNF